MTIEQVNNQLDTIESLFRVTDDTREVNTPLRFLLTTYPTRGKQVRDANLVATMLAYGIDDPQYR